MDDRPRVERARTSGPGGHRRNGSLPQHLDPVLPTLVDRLPEGEGWVHEFKYDGYRIMARIADGAVRLLTRGGHDWSARFPTVASALGRPELEGSFIDGEVAFLKTDGTSDFQALQNVSSRGGEEGVVFVAFDLPYHRNRDLQRVPLEDRKRALRDALDVNGDSFRTGLGDRVCYSEHIRGRGADIYARACRRSFDGVVAKRRGSRYDPGRSRTWVKVRCLRRQEFVVGGWTEPRGSRGRLGALLVGSFDGTGGLVYRGRVGTGFSASSLEALRVRLDDVRSDHPPFVNPPDGSAARIVRWAEPRIVVDVSYADRTPDGVLRHSSFRGVRDDRLPEEVTWSPGLRTGTSGSDGEPGRA